jgi:nucleobase:cation symporter-1, NCS1 family
MSSFTQGLGHDSVQPVHLKQRSMGLFSTFSLWVGANVVVTTVFTGMLFVPDMSYLNALLIILLGSMVGAIPLVLMGAMGTKTGLPTMILTRASFGTRGSMLPSAVNTLVLIGWSWVQAYMAGLSLNHGVFYLTGYSNINLFTILSQVCVVAITIYGHKGIEATENLVASLMIILSAVVFSYMFIAFDIGNLVTMAVSENPAITAMVAFDIVIATAFSWMSSVCDFNRNCQSVKTGVIGTYLGYNFATLLAMGLGATVSGFSLLSNLTQTYDPAELIGQYNPFLGFVAAVVIFLSVLSTNVMALYSATMSYLAMFSKHRFWVPAFIMGIISVIGALLKNWLLENFQVFLLMVGTLFIPVVAITLVDYYVLKRKHYDANEIITNEKQSYWYRNGINYNSYAAYVIGAVFAYYFSYIKTLVTGSTIFTFLLTAVIYWGLMKLTSGSSFSAKQPIDTTVGAK